MGKKANKIMTLSEPNINYDDLEFYRNAFFVVSNTPKYPSCFLILSEGKKPASRIFCSCSPGSYAQCIHATGLLEIHRKNIERNEGEFGYNDFQKGLFWKIFSPFLKNRPIHLDGLNLDICFEEHGNRLTASNHSDGILIKYHSTLPDVIRLYERLGGKDRNHPRRTLCKKAAEFVISPTETELRNAGHLSSRQSEESTLWYVLAYHLYREFRVSDLTITIHIDETEESCILDFLHRNSQIQLQVYVPRQIVFSLYYQLSRIFPEVWPYPAINKPCELFFRLEDQNLEESVTLVSVVDISENPVAPEYYEIKEGLLYGTLLFVPEIKQMVLFSDESNRLLSLHWYKRKQIRRSDLNKFLQENITIFSTPDSSRADETVDLFVPSSGTNFARLIGMPLIDQFDSVEIKPQGADRDWLYLSATYTKGPCIISLEEMLFARQSRQKLLISNQGIIDLDSKSISGILDAVESKTIDGVIRMKRAALLQLQPDSGNQMTVVKNMPSSDIFQRIADCKPAEPLQQLRGYTGVLRHYQELGIQWLLYLYDNGFGGLLCDDMGLGKTHQILGLMVALREQRGCIHPFLIVCPTTVISHWKNIVSTFASTFKVAIFWGGNRDLDSIGRDTDIVLTSYGVLRNDSDQLSDRQFALAVFDEAHYLKNPVTLSFGAACRMNAHFKIVMTGTPIENSISDIKTLFDLVLPGYLGEDSEFQERYVQKIVSNKDLYVHKKLTRLLAPFLLRRIKEAVINELPDKIEEVRECSMSEEQIAMYHEVLSSRGKEVIATLKDEEKPIPYIHIFAALNLLKEICCHPALVLKKTDSYAEHNSVKWDLFTELLSESISSNQKVVVFTQFLGMVAIMETYLKSIRCNHVTLTGSSRNRGAIIDTFNNDLSCKVIICSLKAAGVGIDLTAGSVVIHYDRWWNAAREDQATDRVHRIGQKSTVLVFKLVTVGTLEEKINEIILAKKNLSNTVISVDEPDRLKSFNRQELMSLFSEPKF